MWMGLDSVLDDLLPPLQVVFQWPLTDDPVIDMMKGFAR